MRRLAISICLFGLLFLTYAWVMRGEEVNSYQEIVDMLDIAPMPYENPANLGEANSNAAYIAQNIRAIQQENREWIEKVKRGIAVERALAKGK